MRCVGLRITGRVQGVGYRAWTVGTATRLGLRGWVRNRHDGSVEVLAIGDSDSVEALIVACRQGPRLARVIDLDITDAEDDGGTEFEPRPTV